MYKHNKIINKYIENEKTKVRAPIIPEKRRVYRAF